MRFAIFALFLTVTICFAPASGSGTNSYLGIAEPGILAEYTGGEHARANSIDSVTSTAELMDAQVSQAMRASTIPRTPSRRFWPKFLTIGAARIRQNPTSGIETTPAIPQTTSEPGATPLLLQRVNRHRDPSLTPVVHTTAMIGQGGFPLVREEFSPNDVHFRTLNELLYSTARRNQMLIGQLRARGGEIDRTGRAAFALQRAYAQLPPDLPLATAGNSYLRCEPPLLHLSYFVAAIHDFTWAFRREFQAIPESERARLSAMAACLKRLQ